MLVIELQQSSYIWKENYPIYVRRICLAMSSGIPLFGNMSFIGGSYCSHNQKYDSFGYKSFFALVVHI